MCYSRCPYENRNGECTGRKWRVGVKPHCEDDDEQEVSEDDEWDNEIV